MTPKFDFHSRELLLLRLVSSSLVSLSFIDLGQIETSETQAAQNMKLLYIGMTRAKERLMIPGSGRNVFTERLESMTDPVSAVA